MAPTAFLGFPVRKRRAVDQDRRETVS